MNLSIHIIGLGVSEKAQLDNSALVALSQADWVIGSSRQIAVVEYLLKFQQTKILPQLSELNSWIESEKTQGMKKLVILASGDPLFYGIGAWIKRHFNHENLTFHPAVSSIQSACHRLGHSLQDVTVISLHGRPLESVRRIIKRNQILAVLTDVKSTPKNLAQECRQAGFENARLTVCEDLGYQNENIRQFSVEQLVNSNQSFSDLHVTVIETNTPIPEFETPNFPGIPDEQFITDAEAGKGLITKREIRLVILSLIQPSNDDVIWDVGAGCGSVAIELVYWNERVKAWAIEHHKNRLLCLGKNISRFGVMQSLNSVAGRAPDCLAELPNPNKIFIGGSDGELGAILVQSWQRLPVGGILVASAVTETTKQILLSSMSNTTNARSETLQMAVSKGSELAGQLMYRPNLPVTLFKFIKLECAKTPFKEISSVSTI